MEQKSVQPLEKKAVLLSVSCQEPEIQLNFFPAILLDGKNVVSSLRIVNGMLFALILFVAGTFAAESDKVIYGLVFPIKTFEVLHVQVSPIAPPSLCLRPLWFYWLGFSFIHMYREERFSVWKKHLSFVFFSFSCTTIVICGKSPKPSKQSATNWPLSSMVRVGDPVNLDWVTIPKTPRLVFKKASHQKKKKTQTPTKQFGFLTTSDSQVTPRIPGGGIRICLQFYKKAPHQIESLPPL